MCSALGLSGGSRTLLPKRSVVFPSSNPFPTSPELIDSEEDRSVVKVQRRDHVVLVTVGSVAGCEFNGGSARRRRFWFEEEARRPYETAIAAPTMTSDE